MDTEQLINTLYTELKNQGLWFVTKKDNNWLVKPKKYYTLDEYGELKDKSKVEKEINNNLGDGAETILEAVRIFINDGLADGSIACNCNLSTVFKDKPVDYIETAVEVKNIEPKKIEPEITGSNKKEESKKLNEEDVSDINENLNTGILPIVDVDLYSLYSSDMLDNVPDGDENLVEKLVIDLAPKYIEETIQKVLPSAKVEATNMYHPKEYNFSGDELEFNLRVNSDEYNELKEKVLADEKFSKFLSDNYKSYAGFISTMPDNIDEFNKAPNWKQLVQVIMFSVGDVSSVKDAYLDEFLEKVNEEFPYIDEELSESKDIKDEDYFSRMTKIRENAEQELIERLKKEFPEAKVSNVITSKYRGDRILLTLGKKRISIFFETESGEDGKPWFMILLDTKNKKSYSDNIDGIIAYIKNNMPTDKKTEEYKYIFLKDMLDDNNKELVKYNAVNDSDTGIENVFDFSERNGGCTDSFNYYNDYVVVDKRNKITEDIFDDVSNGIAEYSVYDDRDVRNIKDRYKEPINAKRNKIRNFQNKRFTNMPIRDKINKGVTHISYEKMPNEKSQAYRDSKKTESAVSHNYTVLKNGLDTGFYCTTKQEANDFIDEMQTKGETGKFEIVASNDKSKKIENVQRRLEEENNKSANTISDMFQSKDFDSDSKMGKIVMRTSNLFNVLSDKGYDVQVSFDNGESTNVILLGQQGGQVDITIDNDNQPLKAYANGSFEITEDNMKILNDIQQDIQNI